MDHLSALIKEESIRSFRSTISKCENAWIQMNEKGSNTTLLEKRLNALKVGLAVLENAWHEQTHQYTSEELAEARIILKILVPSIEHSYARLKPGSPQRTLLERRKKSLDQAIQEIDDFCGE
ncbi:hypothetical protein QWY22_10525 [Planococcus liqunii]|uniref:hypothetical protein n=1 Tax=Planococcus liqunii TaxID=3058394 RepID=UPI0026230756|nr:hypothetical protein [Planococcus sp. N056]WKA49342.1 hypothetical protein QWY22_10525 [Planococcus sp. N056]